MNLLYIADGFGTVYMSQVHNLCNAHAINHNVKVISFCKYKDLDLEIDNRKYDLYKVIRPPAFFINSISKLTTLFFRHKELLEWADIIHCRGHGGSLISFHLQDKYKVFRPTIVDIRGVISEEIREAKKSIINDFIAGQVLKTEKLLFRRADTVFFVSKNMQSYFSKQYGNLIKNYEIFPTMVNEEIFYLMPTERADIRRELNIEDKFVYVYSGGILYWQNIDKILLAFGEKAVTENIYLIMLVLDVQAVNILIKELNIDMSYITVMSLKHKDVGRYLNACDAGLIIRNNSIVNYVASPTKINEYIACGLAIVDDLTELGNTNYNSSYWKDNYMSLETAISSQQRVYNDLIPSKEIASISLS